MSKTIRPFAVSTSPFHCTTCGGYFAYHVSTVNGAGYHEGCLPRFTGVAEWSDGWDSFFMPLAIADIRRSRVLAAIRRRGIPCDPSTLTITRVSKTESTDCKHCGKPGHFADEEVTK